MLLLMRAQPIPNWRYSMTKFSKLLPIFGTALLLVACKSAPKLDVATPSKTEPVPVSAPAQAPEPVAASIVAKVVVPDHLNPNSSLSKNRSVFFDYDDFSVKKEFSSLIENHAKYVSANSKLAVKVEGNTDERGGREYNLALGQKRAEAVVRAMKIYGAKDAQMEAVSYGSEKPAALGHDESSWAQNRRADISYQSK
jgi:peptidoglycan-associated lipoprotein